MEYWAEILLAVAAILKVIAMIKDRRFTHEEKEAELEAAEEIREDSLMAQHVEQLERLWEHALSRVDTLTEKVEALQKEVHGLREELSEARAELAASRQENRDLKASVKILTAENQSLRLEVHTLNVKLEEMEKE